MDAARTLTVCSHRSGEGAAASGGTKSPCPGRHRCRKTRRGKRDVVPVGHWSNGPAWLVSNAGVLWFLPYHEVR